MRILVDADACPVVDIVIKLAKKQEQIKVVLICDTAHELNRDGAETIVVSEGADSADFVLVNLVQRNEIVVTQDYGLAAMCLAKRARVLRQDGLEYTEDNIDALLATRHSSQRIRMGGGKVKGNKKRTAKDDENFTNALNTVLCSTKAKIKRD